MARSTSGSCENSEAAESIQAFAAGAILTMLASTMMPEAHEEGGSVVGLAHCGGLPPLLRPEPPRVGWVVNS